MTCKIENVVTINCEFSLPCVNQTSGGNGISTFIQTGKILELSIDSFYCCNVSKDNCICKHGGGSTARALQSSI